MVLLKDTRMHKIVIMLLSIYTCVSTCGLAQDNLDGWTKLFNGTDFTGWTQFLPPDSKLKPGDVWSIKDETIICQGNANGYLSTEKEYSNYELRLQWRWGDKVTSSRNSGVLLHVNGADKLWPKSAEAQLQSGSAGDFWLIDKFKLEIDPARKDPKSGIHYFRMKAEGVEKAVGEWNRYDVTCTSDTIHLKVNGQVVNEGRHPETSHGRICLQSEGAEIHFRDVQIRQIK